jgi:hypothetical protein
MPKRERINGRISLSSELFRKKRHGFLSTQHEAVLASSCSLGPLHFIFNRFHDCCFSVLHPLPILVYAVVVVAVVVECNAFGS